jgi:CRISPR-associated endonuclease/helicase Cas3
MTDELGVSDFRTFFQACNHGHEPFPWQEDLVTTVVGKLASDSDSGPYWPALVDLPTGSGKSSLVDIAIFLLALEAGRPPEDRRLPRRIVFVVDRRVIVDQAHQHARHLVASLVHSIDPVVQSVRARLVSYSKNHDDHNPPTPLATTVLRGGIVRDETWARRPDVPAVITSTVDQVGSRLLFRGYGLSSSARPIHAGLLGTDTLFLLDEVHLSQPFSRTLKALAQEYQPQWAERSIPARWEVTQLSATPDANEANAFRLGKDDYDPARAPVLVRRLRATKPVALKTVPVRTKDQGQADVTFARVSTAEVDRMLGQPYHHAVAVIVNRVDRARVVYRELLARFGEDPGIEVRLVTGRMRSPERDEDVGDLMRRLRTGRERPEDDSKLVVVATQCIEAGADFDFDALVSECASIDALLQRFGRLDRGGWLSANGTPADSVILGRSTDLVRGATDPVYGDALWKTWAALEQLPALDFGPSAMPEGLRRDPGLRPETASWPVLLPTHLDAWVQTNPVPSPDPDPSLWLHGLGQEVLDVTVVWRSDLDSKMFSFPASLDRAIDPTAHDEWLANVRAIVTAIPPAATESISLPISAARRWLLGTRGTWVSDVDGRDENDSDGDLSDLTRPPSDAPRLAIWWNGDGSEVITPQQLKPGMTILVPSAYGGIGRHHSWDPDAAEPVADVAEIAQLQLRGRPVLRLLPGVLPSGVDLPEPDPDDPDLSERDLVIAWLAAQAADLAGPSWASEELSVRGLRATIQVLAETRPAKLVVEPIDLLGTHLGFVITGQRLSPEQSDRCARSLTSGDEDSASAETDATSSEPETSSFIALAAGLTDHLHGVGAWANRLAINCGLHEDLVEDLTLAGQLHDLGKADPRFQAMLRAGGVPLTLEGELLAKSAIAPNDWKARHLAQARSGYPSGTRHELMSLALIDNVQSFQQRAHDWDLVRHLVASHHGWCRPFAPPTPDSQPVDVQVDVGDLHLSQKSDHDLARLDRGVPERFWQLVRQYGWFRLAWLEAILRLADHQRSETEQRRATS